MRGEFAQPRAPVARRGLGDDNHIGLVAGFARQAFGALRRKPRAIDHEGGEALRRRRDQLAADRRRQPGTREQRLAHFAVVAETLDHATHRKFGQFRAGIDRERNRRLARADFGERRRDADGNAGAQGDGALGEGVAYRRAVDQFRLGEQRRTRQNRRRYVGLIVGERGNQRMRRIGGAGEIIGERAAHQRRGIVEQRHHARFRRRVGCARPAPSKDRREPARRRPRNVARPKLSLPTARNYERSWATASFSRRPRKLGFTQQSVTFYGKFPLNDATKLEQLERKRHGGAILPDPARRPSA